MSVDPRGSDSWQSVESRSERAGDTMKETSEQHLAPTAAMLTAKALARWEGEGGALSAQRREDDARAFKDRERTNPLAIGLSQGTGK